MNSPLSKPLLFVHLGDLHITGAKEQNYQDLLSILAQIAAEMQDQLDFVVLPGDNADNGKAYQYHLIATALRMLSVPVYVIPGDHDMEQGSLKNFYGLPVAQQLPFSFSKNNIRCIFLDMCSTGNGGPDFRLGANQLMWLEQTLKQAEGESQKSVLFMHTYPADLADSNEVKALNNLIAEYDVVLADIGHTHYNELANDGHTIFAATRSTGQIEEGPVGYSLVSIHNGSVSWRFKPLADSFPFVLITTPSDYRLLRNVQPSKNEELRIQAKVLGYQAIRQVSCQVKDGDWLLMHFDAALQNWCVSIPMPVTEKVAITIKAQDDSGRIGQHTICAAAALYQVPVRPKADGSDKASIGAWPENNILGTQLGPNRNAKPLS